MTRNYFPNLSLVLRMALSLCLFVALTTSASASGRKKEPVKVACIGNSITYGSGLKAPKQESYPAILAQWMGPKYDVRNFGLSGRTMLQRGDRPYMKEETYRQVKDFQPDIVTIKLGTNDSKPKNWRYGEEFGQDLETMIAELQSLPSRPRIYLCLPIPAVTQAYDIRDSVIVHDIIPIIQTTAKKHKLKVIDLYSAMSPYPTFYGDGVHPNTEGAKVIAAAIYRALLRKAPPAYKQPEPMRTTFVE